MRLAEFINSHTDLSKNKEAQKVLKVDRHMRSYLFKYLLLVAAVAILIAVHSTIGTSTPNDIQIPIPSSSAKFLFVTGIVGLSLARHK